MALTKAQRTWLEKLRDEGVVAKRQNGPTGHRCATKGWAEWVFADQDTGAVVPNCLILRGTFLSTNGRVVKIIGERITEAGRRALEESHE